MTTSASRWQRVVVDDWQVDSTETLGTDGAQWLIDPLGVLWLHKSSRVQQTHTDGEDWAEVATTAVGDHLGIPCARTRLCLRGDRNGSLSRRIHDPSKHDFREGGMVLEDVLGVKVVHDRRDHPQPGDRTLKEGHTLANIHRVLRDMHPPADFAGPDSLTAFDVFAGYVCLDALVVNRDRHEQNWAVLEPALGDGPCELAPSFDHGSAFGYNLTPSKRRTLVTTEGAVKAWLQRGTAWRLEHVKRAGPVSLLDAATAALDLCSDAGRRHWCERFTDVDLDALMSVLPAGGDAIRHSGPEGLSEDALTLIESILVANRRRFRDAVHTS